MLKYERCFNFFDMLNFTILNDVDLYISKNYLMPQSVKKYDTNKNDRNVKDYRYLELSNK